MKKKKHGNDPAGEKRKFPTPVAETGMKPVADAEPAMEADTKPVTEPVAERAMERAAGPVAEPGVNGDMKPVADAESTVDAKPAADAKPAVAEASNVGAAGPSVFGNDSKEADTLWASIKTDAAGPEENGKPAGNGLKDGGEPERGGPEGGEPEEDEPEEDEFEDGESEEKGEPGEDEEPEQDFIMIPGGEEGVAGAAAESGAEKKSGPVKEKAPKPPKRGPFGGNALGPVLVSRPVMADENGQLVPTPPTMFSRLFTLLSLVPILLPLALLVVQVMFTLEVRALWYSDEVRYADAYRNMVSMGDWLVLHMNGAVYPDKPPLFFWMLFGLHEAAALVLPGGLPQPMLFFVGVAFSGLLCLVATHLLAAFVGRVDRRTVLGANLVLISGFFLAGLLHYLRMDLLFTALITFSHVVLFHAWMRDKAPGLMILGFLLAGAAVMTKGPLGYAFPLLAGLCFLIWQGRILRFFRLDAIFGIIIGLALPAAWLGLAYVNLGQGFVDNILHKQVLARALNTWHHAEPWYHYLMTFPLIWLPWTLLLLFLPWGRLFGKSMRAGLKASRTPDAAGIAYLWCAFLPGLVLLSAVSIKLPIYCLPLFPPLAVLTARAVLRMRPFATACMQYTLALLMALLGVSLILLPMVPKELYHLPVLPKATMILGGVCLVFACCMAFLARPRRAEGMLLLTALFTTAFSVPAWYMTAPSLDVFLSPKAQALEIKKYKDAGYAAASVKVYPGTYSYYGGVVKDFDTMDQALAAMDGQPKVVLALRASDWDKTENKPGGYAEVNRQIIAERAYVLVAKPPLDGVKPTPVPTPEAPAPTPPAKPEQLEAAAEKPEGEAEKPAVTPEQTDAAEAAPAVAKPEQPAVPAGAVTQPAPAAPASVPAPAPASPAGLAPAPAEAAAQPRPATP